MKKTTKKKKIPHFSKATSDIHGRQVVETLASFGEQSGPTSLTDGRVGSSELALYRILIAYKFQHHVAISLQVQFKLLEQLLSSQGELESLFHAFKKPKSNLEVGMCNVFL